MNCSFSDLVSLEKECRRDTAPPRAMGIGTITLEKTDVLAFIQKHKDLQQEAQFLRDRWMDRNEK